MRAGVPRPLLLLLIAATSGVLAAVPDPLGVAEEAARAAAVSCDRPAAWLDAQAAAAAAPRRALPHWIAGVLARTIGDDSAARRELDRAAASEPWRGAIQLAVAQDRLVEAVTRRDAAQLAAAGEAFAAALAAGAITPNDAFRALVSAQAPRPLLARLADQRPERLEPLIEQLAAALDADGALAFGDRLDQQRGDPHQQGRALALRRLGAARFAAGRAQEAAETFAAAAALAADPDALSLDRADASLAAGDLTTGCEQLLRALATHRADPARAAAALRAVTSDGSRDERRAAAFFAAAVGASDPVVLRRAARVFAELGRHELEQPLLAAAERRQ